MQVGGPPQIWLTPQQSVGLRPGQVLAAVVESVRGEWVTLRLGSTSLQARAEVPLQPGAQLRLQVLTVQPGQVQLRVLPQNAPGAPPPSPAPNLPDPGTALAARALSVHQLPLTPALLQAVAQALRAFPPNQQTWAAAAAAWLVAHDEPANPAAVRQLVSAQAGSGTPWALGERLESLARALAAAAADPAQRAAAETLRDLGRSLRDWGYAPDGPPPAPLREQLEAAQQALARSGQDTAPAEDARDLLAAVRRLAEAPSRDGDVAVFPLPLKLPGWDGEGLLLVQREPGEQERDRPVSQQVLVYLEPPHLGPLLIDLRQAATGLTASLTAADAEAALLLREALPRLYDALQTRGLHPGVLTAGTGPLPPPAPLRPPAAEVPRGLDLRV